MNKKVGIFSFFAGAGFLDLGFERTGRYETLFVNEFHKPFMEIYKSARENMGIPPPIYGHDTSDISSYLEATQIKSINSKLKEARQSFDLIGFIGGPPCPDFSVGGKNRGHEGERGKLSGTYIELISQTKPDFFLFENVKGLYRTTKHREFFNSLKSKLIQSGYYLTEKLINSIEYGAPQDRERIILIGFKRDILSDFGFLVNGSPIIQNFNWNSNTKYQVKDIFNHAWPKADLFAIDGDRVAPANIPIDVTVEHWFNSNEVSLHPNSAHFFKPKAGLGKFMIIPEGDDLKKSYKRLHRWRYSPTAAYGNNEVHLHPYKARRISAAEALAIQSLPKEFILPEHITLSNMFKTIGNGVPYLAARGLALAIIEFLYANPIKDLKEPYEQIVSK